MDVSPDTAETLVDEVFLFGRALRAAIVHGHDEPLPLALTGLLTVLAARGECRQSELATELCLSQSSLSRQIADLVDAGYVSRHTDPDDKRASRVQVSDDGAALLANTRERRVARLQKMLGDWSENEALAALDSIRHLKETFAAHAQRHQPVSSSNLIRR